METRRVVTGSPSLELCRLQAVALDDSLRLAASKEFAPGGIEAVEQVVVRKAPRKAGVVDESLVSAGIADARRHEDAVPSRDWRRTGCPIVRPANKPGDRHAISRPGPELPSTAERAIIFALLEALSGHSRFATSATGWRSHASGRGETKAQVSNSWFRRLPKRSGSLSDWERNGVECSM